MRTKNLPRSVRKHIRFEKARIRREVFDVARERELIGELYAKFFPSPNVPFVQLPEEKKERAPAAKTPRKIAKVSKTRPAKASAASRKKLIARKVKTVRKTTKKKK